MYKHNIIVFDGVCNLCNAAVNFIIARDPERRFVFASTQSQTGQTLLRDSGLLALQNDTFVLFQYEETNGPDRYLLQSDAALAVASSLTQPWPTIAAVLQYVPVKLRDWLYRLIAKNRYRLFGRRNSCRVPTDADAHRFLTSASAPPLTARASL